MYRLESVDLNVTKRCNLACTFCSVNTERVGSRSRELGLEDIERLFSEFDDLNVCRVRIVGGEPFVRRDIMDILESTSRFRFETSVLTNGTLIKPRHVECMSSCGVANVAISVDGHTPELHDASRNQPRAFDRMIEAVRLCRQARVPLRMMTAVTARNLCHLKDLVVFAERNGFELLNFIVLGFNGLALANRHHFPTFGAWSGAIVALTRFIRECDPDVLVTLLFPHEDAIPFELYTPLAAAGLEELVEEVWGFDLASLGREVPIRTSLCKAGHDGVAIMPNGDVYGCDLMQDILEFRAGNIYTAPLAEIFHRSPVFAEMRARPRVAACARFDHDSTDFSCGQCRAGIRNLQGGEYNLRLHHG